MSEKSSRSATGTRTGIPSKWSDGGGTNVFRFPPADQSASAQSDFSGSGLPDFTGNSEAAPLEVFSFYGALHVSPGPAERADSVEGRSLSLSLWNLKLLYVPVHIPSASHWVLVKIDVEKQVIDIYNSLSSKYSYVEDSLRKYISGDSQSSDTIMTREKSKWKYHYVKGLPCQNNDSDCGVFVLKYLKCCLLGEDINFQAESSSLRQELKNDLLQWKIEPEETVHEKILIPESDSLKDVSDEDQSEKINAITNDEYVDILSHTNKVIQCNYSRCDDHLDRHKVFLKNYQKLYGGRRALIKYGYGMNHISIQAYEEVQERLMKEHLVKKRLGK
uniref:Uncharacterized protein LOC102809783 n=1 Tax=Saccoglossus kowalevskii TaxID=10224 RepID=A0ABM0LV51_SACKO